MPSLIDIVKSALALLIAVASLTLTAHADDRPVLVRAETAQGTVEGESLGKVLAFRGIPYAAPPIGAERFRPPLPPKPHSGIASALDMGPACPQLIDDDPTENNEAVMAEDCLTLNIWTPATDAAKRPVMFWIHGGGFTVGASRNTWYDGAHLAAHGDVVVVTINYRLGAWGFLALPSFGERYAGSANAGLLDQVAALRWVRENIAKFGGDAANVTIFGESAGAASVGDLLAMPAAQGLFAKAILESGLPGGRTGDMTHSKDALGRAYLKILGVHSAGELAAKSMKDLLSAQEKLFETTGDVGAFGPSVDGVALKENPFPMVAAGRASPVPLLLGTTREEMRYFSTAEDIGIEQKPRALMLRQLESTVGPRAPEVLAQYERLYPKWGDVVVQIASDAFMRFPSLELADAVSAHQPVYLYLLTYRSNSTYKNFGSAHAMDLPFVFGNVNAPEVIVFTGRDPKRYELANQIMDYWTSFARSGVPSSPRGPAWPKYNPSARPTMELGPEVKVVDNPLTEQRQIWGATTPTIADSWQFLKQNK